MKLLIAEDNDETRGFIKSLMSSSADEILEASNGNDAVLSFGKHHPDWVLMDIEMPEMDGIEATRRICSEFPEAKILIVSAHDGARMKSAALQAGARGFCSKDDLLSLRSLILDGLHLHSDSK
jgi:DNA-binding NarL/FixJ family response regulator